MRKNFNIDRYLDEAEERFSGFDGSYDDFDGDYDNYDGFDDYDNAEGYDDFDGDNWDLFDGDDYSGANGRQAAPQYKTPSPYVINVTNTTGTSLTLVLFGKNQYLLSTNFGSSTGLVVTPGQTNVSYLMMLQQSADQPFETSLIRVQSNVSEQITQIITVTITDANGQSASLPIVTSSYFSSYQQQSLIVDVPYQVRIDANTSFTTPILATATTTTYTFFPSEKVNVAKGLSGQGAVQVYGNPQVNLGGMTFPKRPTLAGARAGARRIGSKVQSGMKRLAPRRRRR